MIKSNRIESGWGPEWLQIAASMAAEDVEMIWIIGKMILFRVTQHKELLRQSLALSLIHKKLPKQ